MYEYLVMDACAPCACLEPSECKEDNRGTGAADVCESPSVFWEQNPSPLAKATSALQLRSISPAPCRIIPCFLLGFKENKTKKINCILY